MPTTADLIDAAENALQAYDIAAANLQTATTALSNAKATLQIANQNLHDDLVANGPYAWIDTTTTPASVTIYAAADPDTYSATPIRTS